MEIHVNSSTGQTVNKGDFDNPLRFINDAIKIAKPGDKIILRGHFMGLENPINRRQSVFHKGLKGITIAGANGQKAILDFSDMKFVKDNLEGFRLVDCRDIILRNISLQGIKQVSPSPSLAFMLQDCNNIYISNCESFENGGAGFIVSGLSKKIVFKNCDSHHNFDNLTEMPGNHADGFNMAFMKHGSSVYFHDSRSWGNSDDGWDGFGGMGHLYFYNCIGLKNGYSPATGIKTTMANGFKFGKSDESNEVLRYAENCISFANSHSGFHQNMMKASIHLKNCISIKNNYLGFVFNQENNPDLIENCLSFKDGLRGGKPYLVSGNAKQINNSWNQDYQLTENDFISTDPNELLKKRFRNGALTTINFYKNKPGTKMYNEKIGINGGKG